MAIDQPDSELGNTNGTQDLAQQLGGDRQSVLQALYLRVAPALHAWAAIHIPKSLSGRLEASELTQEVWLRALEKCESFDPEATPFRPWIFSIAHFVLLESFRRVARMDSDGGGDRASTFSVGDLPAEITTVSRQVARDEQIQGLIEEAQFLSAEERRLLLFRGLEGLSYEVVADRLGVEAPTAMKRWQRLREGLANRLRLRGVLIET